MELTEKYCGLSDGEVRERRERYGENSLALKREDSALRVLLKFFSEPVFLLLIGAAGLYFFLGEPRDGAVMLVFVAFMGAINFYQEWKTDRTLAALKSLSSPKATAVRGGEVVTLLSRGARPRRYNNRIGGRTDRRGLRTAGKRRLRRRRVGAYRRIGDRLEGLRPARRGRARLAHRPLLRGDERRRRTRRGARNGDGAAHGIRKDRHGRRPGP